jgi:hypothetical protein
LAGISDDIDGGCDLPAGPPPIRLRSAGRNAIVDDRANVHGRASRSFREHARGDIN